MHISEITKKIGPNSLYQIKDHLKNIFHHNYNGTQVEHTDILRFLIKYYSTLKYQNEWHDSGSLNKLDFRFQTFARTEVHTLTYHLSLVSTKNDLENLINECLDLGYSLEMTIDTITNMMEVCLRISFWDRFFYNIEHFVQQMNRKFSFVSDGSTHNKQFYFQEMLNFLDMGTEKYDTSIIIDEINNHFPSGNNEFVRLANQNNRKAMIPYGKFYEYAATMRNSLHNNGFSNKPLNNLDLGIVSFKNIKSGEFITCLSTFHILFLSLPITHILERIVEKTIALYPGELIYDPFTKKLDDFVNKL